MKIYSFRSLVSIWKAGQKASIRIGSLCSLVNRAFEDFEEDEDEEAEDEDEEAEKEDEEAMKKKRRQTYLSLCPQRMSQLQLTNRPSIL